MFQALLDATPAGYRNNRMFQALLDAPPAGYRNTTVQQLLAADQKLWQVVASGKQR